MKTRFLGLVASLALGLGSNTVRSADLTWTGSVSTDWNNPNNWNPVVVPAAGDTINFTSGTISLSSPVTINGQFNWSGGTLSGAALTIAANGLLNLGGTGNKFLYGVLTNAGTVNWTGAGNLYVYNNNGVNYDGGIYNLSGALFSIQNDQLINGNYGYEFFNNAGTVRKSVATGTTTINLAFNNSGALDLQSGTVSLNTGGSLGGSATVAAGARLVFGAGNFLVNGFSASGVVGSQFSFLGGTLSGGAVNLLGTGLVITGSGGSATLTVNAPLPGLTVSGGSLALNATVTNLTLSGGSLAGTNTVLGTMSWTGGNINSGAALTIATDGLLNLGGTANKFLYGVLTNAGTVNWTGAGNLYVYNNNGVNYDGGIYNLSGALFSIQNDQLINGNYGYEFFNNAGTVRKSVATGTTTINLAFNNSGALDLQSGTVSLNTGGSLGGSATVAAGARLVFGAGNFLVNGFSASGVVGSQFSFLGGTLSGGAVNLLGTGLVITGSGGSATLAVNAPLPGLTVSGGSLALNATVTNLTLSGGSLAGTNTVLGTMSWTGGNINSGAALTIATDGLLNLGGTANKFLYGVLTNAGTVNWTGTGNLYVYNNNGVNYDGGIYNLSAALFSIQNDQLINGNYGYEFFNNAGTVRKSVTTGTSVINVAFNNPGTLDVQSGIVSLQGSHSLTNGTLNFGINSMTNFGKLILSGNATLSGSLSANLNNSYLPGAGDSYPVLTYGSASGIFTNLNLPVLSPGQSWQVFYASSAASLQAINLADITAQITGSVNDNQGGGVTNITVFAYTTNTPYFYFSVLTDGNGNYSLNVTNGTWKIGVQGLLARGYSNVSDQSVIVNNANQVVNFVVQPFLGQSFTVTTGINPTETGIANGGGTFPYGSLITVTATPNTNLAPYFFVNWTENGLFQSGSSSYSFIVTRDIQLVANFALPFYLISASNNPAGGGTIVGAGSYIYGTTNVLTASPNPGYNFATWTEGTNILSTNLVLSTVVYSNRLLVANYSEANVIHVVTTATSPAALATVAGAGVYTNGQSVSFSTPAVVVSGQSEYFFQKFVLTNIVVSTSASFTKTFSTVDPTNLEYMAEYASLGITPLVANLTVNLPNPVPATTNFQIVFQFDRTMNTNVMPQVTLTNSVQGALQPVVPAGGHWASFAQNHDTFYPPSIRFTTGMDGAIQVFISGAQDLLGGTIGLTNVYTIVLDATPPILSNLAAAPSVLTAFVTWNSDKPASSLVEYGTSAAYGLNSALDSQLVTAHGVTLYNLNPLTTYHFRVHSRDLAGNEAISGDNSFTTFAAPDLQVTNLSVTGGLVSGGNLLISWTDTNSGSGATFTYWYDQVIVTNSTTGQTLLNSSLFYDPSVNGNLASGDSQNRQFRCQLPNGPSGAGNLQIIVTVNAYGNQYEANGSGNAQINNTESIALSSVLASYPDLQITGLALTNSQLQSGNVVGIVWNDANTGNALAINSFYDQIVVVNQTTGQMLESAVLVDNTAVSPIAPGQSVGRQFSFALPDGTPGAGTLQIMITADIYDNIFEYNASGTAKSNNSNSIAVASALAAYPDLTVTNITGPASAAAGQAVLVSWTDTNLGNAAATNTWTDQIFLADDPALSHEQLLGILTVTNGLGTAQSITNTRTVMLPAFGSGTKWLVVQADAGNGIFELNKTNNTGIATQPLLVAASLTLSMSTASFVQSAPNPAATGTLTRSGDTSTSLTATLASSDTTSATIPPTVTIAAGQSAAAFAVNALLSNLVRGTRVVAITANASGYSAVTNLLTVTDDNVPTLAVSISRRSVGESFAQPIACTVTRNTPTNTALTVQPVSDITKLTVPATVTIPAGAWAASFNASIVSNALPTANAVVSVSAIALGYVSVPDAISIIDDDLPGLVLAIADPFITENSPNPASEGALTLKSPSSMPLNIVLHSDSSLVSIPPVVSMPSNQTSVTFPINIINDHLVHGPKNVTLTAFITDGLLGTILPASGATNTITVVDDNGPSLTLALGAGTISETGSTTATVACNLTPTNDLLVSLASSDTTVATVPAGVTILAGHSSASFTVNGVNPGVPTGSRRVTITGLASNFATGVASLNVSDVNLPDLRVAGISLPASALASTIVTVSYTVENDGIWAATNAWTDFVYYSTSSSGANPQYVSQVLQTNALGVGQSYTNTVNLFLPPDPAHYYILVNANPAKSLTEVSYQNNNLISTGYIDVQPPYRAAIVADLAAAPSGTPIPMHGHAFLAQNPNEPAAFVAVTIRILVKGTRRLFTVTTDLNGNFTYLFQPLSNEAGNYQIAADHPAVATDSIQSGFALFGMSFSDSGLTQSLYPNTVASGLLVLQNLGDLPLSGVAAVVEGATSSLGVQVALSNSIPANGSTLLAYTLIGSNVSSAVQIRARIHVTSAEGAVAYYPLTITVAPQIATLAANPGTLVRAMLRGQQTFVDFDLMNVGGAASGPIQLQLPQVDWLSSASSTNLASLAPGQTNRITLSLTPGPDLALQPYSGIIGVAAANAGLSLPFQFRSISDALGDVQVTVQDDYTFYVAGAPLVTNAVVTLTDPYANAVVASNMTGEDGLVLFTNVHEGTYQLTVTADRHQTFQSPVTVLSGRTNQVTAFIARQTVTYQWTVVPTQIPDNYQVVLESVFETEVPIPVVTIDNPLQIPLIIEGEDTEMDIQVSNHGLIAAQRVQLVVPMNDPDYELAPLTTNIDTVPAMSTITIPVIIRARTNSPTFLARKGIRPLDAGTTITGCPSLPKMTLKWGFICGNDFNWHAVDAELVPVAVTADCAEALKTLLNDEIKGFIKAGKNWKDLLKWKDQLCKVIDVLDACGADRCIVTILQVACGVSSGSFSGALSGALNMRNCFCPRIPDIGSPSSNSTTPPPIGEGGSGGGNAGGNVLVTADQWDWAFSGCTPGQTLGNPTGEVARQVVFGGRHDPKGDGPTTTPGAVCAQVRISIEQQAVVARAAFLGTLSIDNGDPTNALTGVQVALDIRDLNQNPANDLFGINGPLLSGLTAVDGTGTLAPGSSGSARFKFVPTHGAAPIVPMQYQIGGSLQYLQGGSLVQVPLLAQQITVFPDPVLHLLYFQQRDVYGDDPFTPEIEPSEPFDLGLMVTNSGNGKAFNFTITSAQPKIVDNQKGLLINFDIIGTEIGTNAITPSLTANLGEIDPGQAKVGIWEMLSSLQGRFIEYSATFQHMDTFGNPETSLIDSIEIHELIHTVKADRPGDDAVADFLVNDIPDPDNLPDTVYLSDGSAALVTVITNATTDSPPGPGHMQVQLTASMTSGWDYLQLPDPGAGFLLYRAVRSDGKEMLMTNNVWTTDRSFPSSRTGAVREHLLHLFDWAGTGSYTLFYHSTNTTLPAIVSVGPVTPFNQSSAVSAVNIVFREPVDTTTFSYTNVILTLNDGANLISNGAGISLTLVSNNIYSINGLGPFSAADGNYQLTVNGSGIYDFWGNNAGNVSASSQWAKGNAAPVVQSISAISPNPRNTPVTTVTLNFSKAISAATFNYQALSLTLNGGPNLITSAVTVNPQSASSMTIGGLGPLTGAQGNYVLTVSAAAVQDTDGTAGLSFQSVGWSTITAGPTVTALDQVTTNPRNIVVQSLNVTFSEPIDPATFDYHAITLTRDDGVNLVTSDVTVTPLNPTTYQVGNLSWVQGYAGTYSFTVNAAGIADLAGNAGTGSTNETWQIILETPAAPANLFITPDLGISSTDGLTSTNNITLVGTVGATNLTVRVYDVTAGSDLGTAVVNGMNFSEFISFTTLGLHHLQVTTVDAAGNVSPTTFFDLFLDLTPPTAILHQVSPNPHYSAVTNVNVIFSKAVDTNTVNAANFLLIGNGTSSFAPTVSFVSSNQFLVGGLQGFTAPLGSYQLVLSLNGIRDLAGNVNTNAISMSWTHIATNLPPVIAQATNIFVAPGSSARFQAQGSDPDGSPLTWTLAPGAPAGAFINPTNGIFAWTPSCAQGSTTNLITVWATDSGSPPQSNLMSFSVIVGDCIQIGLGEVSLLTGHSACLPVNLLSTVDLTNLGFTLTYPSNRLGNWVMTATNPVVGTDTVQVLDSTQVQFQIVTKPGQVLQGPMSLGTICFNALPGLSGFIQVQAANVVGSKLDGSSVGNPFGQFTRLVIVGSEPLLEASLTTNFARLLTLYGKPGAAYRIESKTNLVSGEWQPRWNVPLSNLSQAFGIGTNPPAQFYRAYEFFADPPVLELSPLTGTNVLLLLYGKAGTNYVIEATTNLSSPSAWFPATNFTLTNSFLYISVGKATNRAMFFKAVRP